MGYFDFAAFFSFLIHCLWSFPFGVQSNKTQKRKGLTVAKIYKLDRCAVVSFFLKREARCSIFVFDQYLIPIHDSEL